VLAGTLPRPGFPPKLRQTAPVAWFRLAAGALHYADVYAGRQDRLAHPEQDLGRLVSDVRACLELTDAVW